MKKEYVMRWEYMYLELLCSSFGDKLIEVNRVNGEYTELNPDRKTGFWTGEARILPKLFNHLNELGDQGWELVDSMNVLGTESTPTGTQVLIFKRPKE